MSRTTVRFAMWPECTARLETAVILLSGPFPKDTCFPL